MIDNQSNNQQANTTPQIHLSQLPNEHRMEYPFHVFNTSPNNLQQHVPDPRVSSFSQHGERHPDANVVPSDSSQELRQIHKESEQNDKELTPSFEEIRCKAEDLAKRNKFGEALKYFEQLIKMDSTNGVIWGILGHCYLLMENLQEAFNSYQKALYYSPDVKDPQLFYGIGLVYEKVLSLIKNSMNAMNAQYQTSCIH